MEVFNSKQQNQKIIASVLAAVVMLSLVHVLPLHVEAAPNLQINYQGKLTNSSNVAVADGEYDMEFNLYAVSSGGTSLWTENRAVTVTNGLFSVMLGASTTLATVDFNQTLYLGVEIENDGEMSPRKVLGAVPAAFEADRLDGLNSTQLVRSDATSTISTSSTDTLLSLVQSGIGDILNIFDGAVEVFSILDGGNVGIGSTTPSAKLTVSGNGYFGGNLTATGTLSVSDLATFSSGINVNGETFTDLTGSGLANVGGVLTVSTSSLANLDADTLDGEDGSYYLNRANHTGTQTASTISDFSSTARGLFSSTATGLTYTSGTGVFSLTSGYTIPLTASTTEWDLAYASTTALTPSYLRGLFSNTATGLTYDSGTGITSLTSGYTIPLTASTTNWNTFYDSPSNRITAGANLTWSGNTLVGTFGTSSARASVSETATGLDYDSSTGVFSLTFGYNIPLTASTTNWETAFQWGDHGSQNYFDKDIDDTDDLTEGSTNLFSQWANIAGGINYAGGNVGIGSTSPAAKLGVNGNTYIGGALTATGTLNISGHSTLASASSTDFTASGNAYIGTDLTVTGDLTVASLINGCVEVSGGLLTSTGSNCGTGSGGVTSLNGLTTASQTFATSTSGGINLVITSTSSVHTFTASPASGYTIPLTASTTEWDLAYASTTALTPSYIRELFSSTSPVAYNSGTGIFSITADAIGDTELAFNTGQHLTTTSSPTFTALNLTNGSTTNITVSGATYLNGALRDSTNNAGTLGMILQATGTSTRWVATSTLGLASTADFDTSAELAAILTDETGTAGSVVFSAGPTFTGNTTLANASTTNLTNSGNAYIGTILSGTWNGTDIDISDYTNLGVTATGLELSGDNIALTSGYNIPLTASTTNWNTFYDTPSNRITAGDALTWSGNTLNFDGGDAPAGELGGTWASPTIDDSLAVTDWTFTTPSFLTSLTASDDDWIGLGASAGRIEFDDQATDEVNILSANVGIGTSTPTAKLSVGGNVRIDGNLTATGTLAVTGAATLSSTLNVTGNTTLANASTTNLTNSGNAYLGTILSGTWNGSTIGTTYGGTGLTSYSTGDLLYASGANTLAKRTIGSTGDVLTVSGGVPTWAATSTLGFTTNSDFDTSAELAAILTDETGTAGFVVFSAGPTFTGNTTLANASTTNLTVSGASYFGGLLSLTGSAANIALGSNYLSGDGDDEGIFITSGGNVGIGTTTPAQKLTIYRNDSDATNALEIEQSGSGDASLRFVTTAATGWTMGIDNSDGDRFKIGTSQSFATNYITIETSGDIGIGTTTPGEKLVVDGTIVSGGSTLGKLTLLNTAGAERGYLQNTGSSIELSSANSAALVFAVNATEALRIINGGNVGIGTTTPDGKLSIYTGASAALAPNANADELVLEGSGATGLTIKSPSSATGNIYFADPGNAIAGRISYDHTSDSLILRTNGTDRVYIDSNGNLGIGSTTPAAKLGVNGNTYIGGDLTATGTLAVTGAATLSSTLNVTGNTTLANASTTNITITGRTYLNGALHDSTNNAGTLGMVLQATGTSTRWVATSTLGIGGIDGSGSSNRVAYWSDADTLTSNSAFTFDGTSLTAPIFNASGVSTTVLSLGGVSFIKASTTLANTALGFNALSATTTGIRNTAFGDTALQINTTGQQNSAFGAYTLYTNTTGSYNTANGYSALYSNTAGDENTAFGNLALYSNSTGGINTAVGSWSLYNNTIGSSNTAIGSGALVNNVAGSRNVALGYYALQNNNATGTISIGYLAGDNLTSGDYNIIIGYDIDAPTATSDNILNIGNLIFGTGIDGTGTTHSSGNIGIGSSTPSSKLTVSGNTYIGGDLTATGTLAITGHSTLATASSTSLTNSGASYFGGLLSLTGSAANIALGSNWLSGDGDDEGIAVSSGGNVGVGTSTLNNKFVVALGSSEIAQLNDGNSASAFWGQNVGFISELGEARVTTRSTSPLVFLTGGTINSMTEGTERMRIMTSGNVGIGTSSPAFTLQVSTSTSGTAYAMALNNQNGGTNSATNLRFANTTVPGQLATVNGVTDLYATRQSDGSNNFTIANSVGSSVGPSANLTVVGASGNVGIGTTTPQAALHIGSTAAQLRLNTTAANSGIYGVNDSSGNAAFSLTRQSLFGSNVDLLIAGFTGIAFAPNTGTGAANTASTANVGMYLNSSGNLGIGTTTPSVKLQVNDDANTISSSNSGQLVLAGETVPTKKLVLGYDTDSNVGAIQAVWSGIDWSSLILNPHGGNVGIGTTTPAGKLGVNGSAYIGGNLTATGTLAVTGLATFSSGISVNSETVTDFTGLGMAIASGALGLTSSGAADEECLTYEETGTTVEWSSCAGLSFGTDNQIPFTNSAGTDFDYSSLFTFDGTTFTVGATSSLATTTISRLSLTGAFRDSTSSAGTNGMILKSTGTSTQWIATSTLGLGNGTFLGLSDTPSSYTLGSVLFTSSTTVSQDNAAFYYDDANNRLAIGHNSFTGIPSGTDLAVISTSTATSRFSVANTNGTAVVGIFDARNDGTAQLQFGSTSNHPLAFFTNNTHVMTLDVNGRLGIGSTTPSSRLTIDGNLAFSSAAFILMPSNNASALSFATSTTGIPLLKFNTTNGAEEVTVGVPGGDVIIGAVGTPTDLVFEESSTIHGQGANTLTFGETGDKINFAVNVGFGTSTPTTTVDIYGPAGLRDIFAISSSTNERLFTVTAAGNVGIGTSTPSRILDVNGDVGINSDGGVGDTNYMYVTGNRALFGYNGSLAAAVVQGGGGKHIVFQTNGANERMRIASDGNVGIGTTTPLAQLSVASSTSGYITIGTAGTQGTRIVFGSSATTTTWIQDNAAGSFRLYNSQNADGSSGTNALTITADRNFGIGTTTPSSKLTVFGDVHLSGSSRYLNFGPAIGTNGYGFRDNAGTMQFKNSGGDWTNFLTEDNVVVLAAIRNYSATTTWNKPANLAYVIVEVWGAGGGGGGADGSTSTADTDAGGGGGGAYAQKKIAAVSLGSTETAGVPTGGTAGANTGTTGGKGGVATFGSHVSANGGFGGHGITGSGGDSIGGDGGAAGTSGDINLAGEQGGHGRSEDHSGKGGDAPRGGSGGPSATSTRAGFPGNAPGGGGSGGNNTGTGGQAGGTGGAGGVVVYEYVATTSLTGADLAEMYPVSDPTLEAGDIVAFDKGLPITVNKADANETRPLAGIISSQPGLVLGNQYDTGQRAVGLAGRVPAKVNLEGGEIAIGDRIALSSVPGVGKRATAFEDSVGIAIDNYVPVEGEEYGMVTVFIDLQEGYDASAIVAALLGNTTASSTATSTQLSFIDSILLAIENKFTTPTGTSTATSTETVQESETLWTRIVKLAQNFVDGVLKLAGITIGTSEKPAGITLYDEATGEPYCVKIRNGAMVHTAGECSSETEEIPEEPIEEEPQGETPGEETPPEETPENPEEPVDPETPPAEEVPPAEGETSGTETQTTDTTTTEMNNVENSETSAPANTTSTTGSTSESTGTSAGTASSGGGTTSGTNGGSTSGTSSSGSTDSSSTSGSTGTSSAGESGTGGSSTGGGASSGGGGDPGSSSDGGV